MRLARIVFSWAWVIFPSLTALSRFVLARSLSAVTRSSTVFPWTPPRVGERLAALERRLDVGDRHAEERRGRVERAAALLARRRHARPVVDERRDLRRCTPASTRVSWSAVIQPAAFWLSRFVFWAATIALIRSAAVLPLAVASCASVLPPLRSDASVETEMPRNDAAGVRTSDARDRRRRPGLRARRGRRGRRRSRGPSIPGPPMPGRAPKPKPPPTRPPRPEAAVARTVRERAARTGRGRAPRRQTPS